MTKPEKRWQLLLVADDGRIIPFKRIKGIALTMAILLVLLGLVCVGLGWQLTAEKIRHHRALDQLTDANRQVAHYKREHELITTELVLAEARLEKAGLRSPGIGERISQQPPVMSSDTEPVFEDQPDDGEKVIEPETTASPDADNQAAVPPTAAPVPSVAKAAAPEGSPTTVTAKPEPPAVTLGDLELKYDAGEKNLLARFRVINNGPRSSPVAGRCVVVLKSDWMAPEAWLPMPALTLVNGRPDGEQGQAFKISRFIDVEIKAKGQMDPSAFTTATVFVFDTSGAQVLAKDFPIVIPAPKPEAAFAPPAQPLAESVKIDDPSLTESVKRVKKEDAHGRF